MHDCKACKKGTLELVEGLCEFCYIHYYIKPLEAQAQELRARLSFVHQEIFERTSKLAKRVDPRSNTPMKCACGAKFQSGLDLAAHTQVCNDRETAKKTTQVHQARIRPNVVY